MDTTSFVLRRLFTAHTVPDVTLMPSWPALACGLNGWVSHEPSLASLPRSGVGTQQCRARDPDPSPADLVLAVLHEVRQLGDIRCNPPRDYASSQSKSLFSLFIDNLDVVLITKFNHTKFDADHKNSLFVR